MAFVFNEGGAPIPMVPGTTGGFRPPAPAAPSYSTGFLTETAGNLEAVRRQNAMALQGTGTGSPYVWLGSEKSPRIKKQAPEGRWHNLKNIDTLMSEFEAEPNEKKRQMAKLLALAGYLDVPYAKTLDETITQANLMDVTDAYAALLKDASARFAAGQNMSPDALLEMNIRYNLAASGLDLKDVQGKDGKLNIDSLFKKVTGKDKPHTEVTKSKSYDIWSPEDARGLARQTLQSVLGRDPSEAEYEDFIAALHKEQRDNPTIETTRTHYDAQGNATSQRTSRTGGLGEAGIQELARQEAESAPDFAEWQAVGTYFPAVMQALGAAVPGA